MAPRENDAAVLKRNLRENFEEAKFETGKLRNHYPPPSVVTDETEVIIPKNMSEWENKCIFYSPKIETGVDFNIDTKQSVFFHMKGESILPTSSFQMIARTRNMKDLTYYCVDKKIKRLQI
jgi:hypothetical protein